MKGAFFALVLALFLVPLAYSQTCDVTTFEGSTEGSPPGSEKTVSLEQGIWNTDAEVSIEKGAGIELARFQVNGDYCVATQTAGVPLSFTILESSAITAIPPNDFDNNASLDDAGTPRIVFAMDSYGSGKIVNYSDQTTAAQALYENPSILAYLGGSHASAARRNPNLPKVLVFHGSLMTACARITDPTDPYYYLNADEQIFYSSTGNLPPEYDTAQEIDAAGYDAVIYCAESLSAFPEEAFTAGEIAALQDFAKVYGGGVMLAGDFYDAVRAGADTALSNLNSIANDAGANFEAIDLPWGAATSTTAAYNLMCGGFDLSLDAGQDGVEELSAYNLVLEETVNDVLTFNKTKKNLTDELENAASLCADAPADCIVSLALKADAIAELKLSNLCIKYEQPQGDISLDSVEVAPAVVVETSFEATAVVSNNNPGTVTADVEMVLYGPDGLQVGDACTRLDNDFGTDATEVSVTCNLGSAAATGIHRIAARLVNIDMSACGACSNDSTLNDAKTEFLTVVEAPPAAVAVPEMPLLLVPLAALAVLLVIRRR